MSWGILRMFGSVTILAFTIPPALAGAEFLLRGDIFVGAGLLGAALTMVTLDRYVTTPGDLPGVIAGKLVETVVRSSDEE
jgi:hypothetical protein